jgi:putative membrane protein
MTCCWGMGDGLPMWMMPLGFLFMLVFWGAIIFLIVWAIRSFMAQGRGYHPGNGVSILNERYARGEVTREQYEQMKRDLES